MTAILSTSFAQVEKSQTLKLAEIFFNDEEYEKALEYYMDAWKSGDTNSENIPDKIASCYYITKKYDKAIYWFQKALKYPTTQWQLASIYSSLGWSYESTNHHNKAIENFKAAEKLGITFPSEFLFESEGWYFVTMSGRDHIYYKKDIKKTNSGSYRVWTKWYWDENSISTEDIKRISELGGDMSAQNKLEDEILKERNGVKSSKVLFEIDCTNQKMRTLSTTDYGVDGALIGSFNSEGEWRFVVPESVGESLESIICK